MSERERERKREREKERERDFEGETKHVTTMNKSVCLALFIIL